MLQYRVTCIFSYAGVLLHCICAVVTRVVNMPFIVVKSFYQHDPFARLVCWWNHQITALSTSVIYVPTCSEFLSPSIFNIIVKWACSTKANWCKFDSPSYSTLKKQMNYTFPNTINGGGLKSKVFLPEEVGSDLPVTMWYFEPLELFAKSLWDPQVMKDFDFVCFP